MDQRVVFGLFLVLVSTGGIIRMIALRGQRRKSANKDAPQNRWTDIGYIASWVILMLGGVLIILLAILIPQE